MLSSLVPTPRLVAGLHASYLIATGVWPLLHRRSFEAVTGPKPELWLVRTVGGLAAACGVTLATAAVRGRRPAEVQILAAAQALAFATADVYAAATRSRVYLGDIVFQAACLPAWLASWEGPSGVTPAARPRSAR